MKNNNRTIYFGVVKMSKYPFESIEPKWIIKIASMQF